MKLRKLIEQMDYEGIEDSIEQFKDGTMSRQKFLDYIQNQVQQGKQEHQQMQSRVKQLQNRMQQLRRGANDTQKQGVGSSQRVGS